MTYKTAVCLAEALESHKTAYPIQFLEFAGIDVGELGMRRLCELLTKNDQIKMLVAGIVKGNALLILAEHVENFVGLQTLHFEEPNTEHNNWDKKTLNEFITGFRKSEVLLDVKVEPTHNKEFPKEINFYAELNRKNAELKKHLEESNDPENSEKFFSSIVYF